MATNYLTKWVETKASVKNNTKTMAKLLYKHIFTHIGLPIKLVSDMGVQFINKIISLLLAKFMDLHKRSSSYHPHASGKVESTSKILCTTLTKVVSESQMH